MSDLKHCNICGANYENAVHLCDVYNAESYYISKNEIIAKQAATIAAMEEKVASAIRFVEVNDFCDYDEFGNHLDSCDKCIILKKLRAERGK